MDVHHIFLCFFFFLSLQDGNTGLTNEQIITYTGTEGGNVTVGCSFSFSGSRKLFCKGDCTTGNILIETTNDRAQSGRYSIEYEEGFFPSTPTLTYVSITQLKKSDSGLYTCSLPGILLPDSNSEFRIIVTETSTETTLQPFTTSRTSSSTQSLSSSSGRFATETESPAGTVLVISLNLVVVIIILSVALLMRRKRKRKFKGSPVETPCDNVRESSRVYDEIGDPVEMSTVYTLISQNGVRPTDEYSLATGTCAQNQIAK
ncbi:hypothetical protein Q5P01_008214 [Channa striata]|uniref:Immunoglobulin subtype domain-containing protein n=1 Tax=Channa striata TaxID=64152 RepID=A0AA88T2U3_CHASR|nr:hypothetical protein Q5P01_008214 [Channa striata]